MRAEAKSGGDGLGALTGCRAARRALSGLLRPVAAAAALALTVAPAAASDAAPEAAGFSVSGTVVYRGEPPRRTVLRMDADPNCTAMHEGKRVLSRDRLIGEDGAVENVFVHLREAPEPPVSRGGASDRPTEAVRLTQRGCLYTPRIVGVRVAQGIEIVNDDPTLHNVRAVAKANRPFNIGQPVRGSRVKSFRAPEKPVRIKCDVHPWMSAYVFVLEHSFHSTTGSDGKYRIDGLPAGAHELVFWHEKLGERTVEVEVAGDVDNLNLVFEPAKTRPAR